MKTSNAYLRMFAALNAAMLFCVGGASAGPPPPTATAVLDCDRNVDSDVHVDLLQGGMFSNVVVGSADLSCGPDSVSGLNRDRQRVPVTGAYDAINITLFTVQDASGSGGCVGRSVVPAKVPCDLPNGRGATLTVR